MNSLKKIKKIVSIVCCLLFCAYLCDAQMLRQRSGKLETIKMSYITKRLNLSDKEAQKFWVVYPQYIDEVSAARHKCFGNEIGCEEQVWRIKRKYSSIFQSILKDPQRVHMVFTLEKNYREMLRRELRKRVKTPNS